MADLLWDDVKSFFDPDLMGALPDVVVPGTSVEDWQAVLDLVERSGWSCRYSEGAAELPVPRAEAVLSRPASRSARNSGSARPSRSWRSSVSTRRRRSTSTSICGNSRARAGSTCSATSSPRSAGAWASRC
ncbi:hypothetical protein GCM10010295_48830 [Streptomyces intermedius]